MTKQKRADIDGEDDAGESAVDRDVAKVREKAAAKDAEGPSSSDDDSDPEVDIDDDDDDEPSRPSRSERRRDRGANLVAEANARAAAAERRAAEAERLARETASRIPRQPEKDPVDDEIDSAYAEQQRLYREYEAHKKAGALTAESIADFEKRGREIELRKYRAVAKKEMGGSRGVNPEEVVARVRQQQLAEEHADVIANPTYFRWAKGRMDQELAEGKPDTKATVDAVMDLARRKFGLTPRGGRPAPSDAMKRRLGGVARGGGGGMGDSERNTVVMTKDLRRLADAAYPHIKDEKERYKMWAKGPGRRLQESGKLAQ